MKGFCIKCRAYVDTVDSVVARGSRISNLVLVSACPQCGSSIYRISTLRRPTSAGKGEGDE